MLDMVSMVRSDNDGRCRRGSRTVGSSTFSTLWLAAFSSPLLTIAASAFELGGVVLREP